MNSPSSNSTLSRAAGRCVPLRAAGDCHVVGGEHEQGEIEAGQGQDKGLQRPLRQAEDALGPKFHLAGRVENGLDRFCDPESFR